ncbi:MAG: hypothetical protein N2C12_06875 [Planctomycetales bacterium]
MLFSTMPVALSKIRGLRYGYTIGGIALWRTIAIITGMDAKDRIIAEQRVLIEELRREIEELKLALAKATKDSSNSSRVNR